MRCINGILTVGKVAASLITFTRYVFPSEGRVTIFSKKLDYQDLQIVVHCCNNPIYD